MSFILSKNETIYLEKSGTSETLITLQAQALAGDIRSAVDGPESNERIVVVSDDVNPANSQPAFRLAETHVKDIDASREVTADDFSAAQDLRVAVGSGFFVVCRPGILAAPFITAPLP